MASGIRKFIERQLKENVPLSQIRNELKEKGYDLESINKAVSDAISGVNKRTSNTTLFQVGILAIGVILAIAAAVYFSTDKGISQNIIKELCNGVQSPDNLDCQEAVSLALEKYPGDAIKIELGNMTYRGRYIYKNPESVESGDVVRSTWFVDINLKESVESPIGNVNNVQIIVDTLNKTALIYQYFEGT